MSDAYVTQEMRIRDLLAHRSGLTLGAGDLLYWPATTYSTDEVVARLAKVPLKGGFRDRYAYDNILYAVAQRVIEQVSGQSYAQFLQQRIFDRVGMSGARFNADHLQPVSQAGTQVAGLVKAYRPRLRQQRVAYLAADPPSFTSAWEYAMAESGLLAPVPAAWAEEQVGGVILVMSRAIAFDRHPPGVSRG